MRTTLDSVEGCARLRSIAATPFNHTIVVYRWQDFEEVKRIFPGMEEAPETSWGRCTEYDDDEGYRFILMGFREDDLSMNVLTHECTHAKNFIFSAVGCRLDPYNDEFEAYFMGWLVQQVFWKWEELK